MEIIVGDAQRRLATEAFSSQQLSNLLWALCISQVQHMSSMDAVYALDKWQRLLLSLQHKRCRSRHVCIRPDNVTPSALHAKHPSSTCYSQHVRVLCSIALRRFGMPSWGTLQTWAPQLASCHQRPSLKYTRQVACCHPVG